MRLCRSSQSPNRAIAMALVLAVSWSAPATADDERELPGWFGGFTGPVAEQPDAQGSDTAASEATPSSMTAPTPMPQERPTQQFHDWGQGLSWYEEQASQGDAKVQFRLAEVLESGVLGEPDFVGARRWYDAAARQGHVQAQFRLANMLRTGRGGPADPVSAAQWYRAAAQAGFGPAAFNLAIMLDGGVGVPSDPATAARFYGLAVRNGVMAAATNLGLLYLQGRGVEEDAVTALSWLTVAARAAVPGAEQARRDLAEGLDESQRQAAAEQANGLISQ